MDTEVIEQPAAPPPPGAAPASASTARTAWIVAGVATAVALLAVVVAVGALARDDDERRHPIGALRDLPREVKRAAEEHRPVTGTISSIDGTSFKVKQSFPNGETDTTTVETSRNTTFRRVGTGELSELAVGETIAVHGTEADGVLTATRIVEAGGRGGVVKAGGPAVAIAGEHIARAGGRMAARIGGMNIGEITKIEGDTITITAFDGTTKTVKTTGDTVVHVNESITMKDLKKGDRVRVMGKVSDDKVEAHEVVKGDFDDDERA